MQVSEARETKSSLKAYARICPKCEAPAGHYCERQKIKGPVLTKTLMLPHAERKWDTKDMLSNMMADYYRRSM